MQTKLKLLLLVSSMLLALGIVTTINVSVNFIPHHKEHQVQNLKKRANVRQKFAVALIVLQEFLTKQ